jgi:hypothetical protein
MDLHNFIKASGLDFNAVAAALFPDNKHPYHSLWKLIKDGGDLKVSQLRTLSTMSGTPPEVIMGLQWRGVLSGGYIEVSSQGYTAKYRGGDAFYTLSRNGEELGPFEIEGSLSVRGFISEVKNTILNYILNSDDQN